MKLRIEALCHKGLVRENNEDAVSVGGLFLRDDSADLTLTTPGQGYFFVLVSDGMGGHENGEEASEYTLKTINQALEEGRIKGESLEEDLRAVVREVSDELNSRASMRGQLHPMGCTLSGVLWFDGHVYLVNAGDSRTYRIREGILRLLTTDETERGLTGDPGASKYLLNCIGGGCEGRLSIDSLDGKLLEGDTLLVCSDGLTDMVREEDIEGCTSAGDLLRMACEGGGADNISIIFATLMG